MCVDRFAVGSFIEEYCNEVKIISLDDSGEFVATHKVGCVRVADCMCDTYKTRLTSHPPLLHCAAQFDHPYPTTKIQWLPSKSTSHKDLLATTGDYLRVWEVKGDEVAVKHLYNSVCPNLTVWLFCRRLKPHTLRLLFVAAYSRLTQNSKSEYCAPLTAFDWNTADVNRIGTASIDTTCTIWDLEVDTQTHIHTQLLCPCHMPSLSLTHPSLPPVPPLLSGTKV